MEIEEQSLDRIDPLRRKWLLEAPFLTFALLASVREALACHGDSSWLETQRELAELLAAGRITPMQWQAGVEGLAKEVDLAEVLALLAGSRVKPALTGSHNDPVKRFVSFLDAEGRVQSIPFGAALFDFSPRNVVTPHGHRNMVSAHLVVKGKLRARTFDRVGEAPGAMVIRPLEDRIVEAGEVSTMSSDRANIHWFVPVGGAATTFDVVISGLDAKRPDYEIKAIDPLHGTRRADGSIVARVVDFERAAELYPADV